MQPSAPELTPHSDTSSDVMEMTFALPIMSDNEANLPPVLSEHDQKLTPDGALDPAQRLTLISNVVTTHFITGIRLVLVVG